MGNFWGFHTGHPAKFDAGLTKYLRSLEQRSYPFYRAAVQFSGYHTDNSPPSVIASDLVRRWNEQHVWPRLRLSVAREFLEFVEREHGKDLPVNRQAWPDWWTDGFGSAARETAASRETNAARQLTEGLLAMSALRGRAVPEAILRGAAEVHEDLMFYDEHTFGAAESVDDPLAENSQAQWSEKSSYVWTAVKDASLLREDAFGLFQEFLPRADVPTLAVATSGTVLAQQGPTFSLGGTPYTKWLWGNQRTDGSVYNFTTVPGEGYGDNGQGSEVELLIDAKLSRALQVTARLHSSGSTRTSGRISAVSAARSTTTASAATAASSTRARTSTSSSAAYGIRPPRSHAIHSARG